MKLLLGLSIALIAMNWVSALPAQTPLRSEDIIVKGATRREAQRKADAYIGKLGVVVPEYSIARWSDPICLKVIGLPDDQVAYVRRWFREIVLAVGTDFDNHAKCEANLVISFVSDGPAFAKLISLKRVWTLGDMSGPELHRLLESQEPIRWWHLTGYAQNKDSHILAQISRSIVATTIIVDTNRAAGFRLWGVTQYAAFVALSGAEVGAHPQPGSILNLFHDPSTDSALSRNDMLFLQELYRMPGDRDGIYGRGRLIEALVIGRVKP